MNFLMEAMSTVFAQFVSKQYWGKLNKIFNKKKILCQSPGYEQTDNIIDVFHFLVSRVLGGCRPIYYPWFTPTIFTDINGKLIAEIRQPKVLFLFMKWDHSICYKRASVLHYTLKTDKNANSNYVSVWEKKYALIKYNIRNIHLKQGCFHYKVTNLPNWLHCFCSHRLSPLPPTYA